MSDTVRCPDCGHENPSDALNCAACGFPLKPEALPPAAKAPAGGEPARPSPEAPASGSAAETPILLPPRRRPPRPRMPNEALSLWLVFGTIMALVVIYVAVKANVDRFRPPVEGATPVQQVSSDSLRGVLDKDSTNVEAQIRLGDVLYDTANWSEAIVHYRAAIRRDSSQVSALVDLGVCYYNLGDAAEAERHFLLALARDPHQPIALFNLGIVHERGGDPGRALEYYHRALQSGPPPEMQQALIEAMNRLQDKTGVKARPFKGGS
jgi:tetratricopeptide (TPR) repeat protein